MVTREQKIRRGFHWVAVILAALLLALGLVLITFDVRDLWHPNEEDIPPTSIGALLLGVPGARDSFRGGVGRSASFRVDRGSALPSI